ncbi:Uncharacterised protein [Edwardsiella ictaluri]|nr:Uncharacterised protein [Edwardsiella ictaluri]
MSYHARKTLQAAYCSACYLSIHEKSGITGSVTGNDDSDQNALADQKQFRKRIKESVTIYNHERPQRALNAKRLVISIRRFRRKSINLYQDTLPISVHRQSTGTLSSAALSTGAPLRRIGRYRRYRRGLIYRITSLFPGGNPAWQAIDMPVAQRSGPHGCIM